MYGHSAVIGVLIPYVLDRKARRTNFASAEKDKMIKSIAAMSDISDDMDALLDEDAATDANGKAKPKSKAKAKSVAKPVPWLGSCYSWQTDDIMLIMIKPFDCPMVSALVLVLCMY